MYKNGDEELILCPYNRSHVVSKLRIQKHIIKCQKNHPSVKLATCFYNFTHRLKPEDMLKHYEICPQRIRVEGARYYDPGSYKPIDFLIKNDNDSFHFPTTHVKTHEHFCNPCAVVSNSSNGEIKFKRKTELFEFTSHHMSPINIKSCPQTDFLSNDDEDDDKPLPLPRTVSKAFTSIKQNQQNSSTNISETPQRKGFGRATNIQTCSLLRQPRTSGHLLPDLSYKNSSLVGKNSKFFSTASTNCHVSDVSSLFDDSVTLKSQSIIFDDDYNTEEESNDLILKNVDKYKKISQDDI